MLYGATYGGGSGGGSICTVDPDNDAYTIVYGLDQTNHGAITDQLLLASDGNFYGTSSQGGLNGNAGTIFRYDPVGDTFVKLHDFDGAEGGRTPYGGLCEASNGWLYGVTYEGGLNNHGVVYKCDPTGPDFVKLFDLDGARLQLLDRHGECR